MRKSLSRRPKGLTLCEKIMKTKGMILLLAASLAGCDTLYGLRRYATVSELPPPSALRGKIEQLPEVQRVEYRHTQGGRPVTLRCAVAPEDIHSFSYAGTSNVRGTLQFIVDNTGKVRYQQTLLGMGRPPPQAWVDATQPVMLKIEAILERDYGLHLRDSVQENRHGVK